MTSPPLLSPAVPFASDLATHGDRPALITPAGELSYRELAERVTALAARLGGRRRLVLVAGANTTQAVVGYLAALAGGHPVLLAPGDQPATIAALTCAYDPDVMISGGQVEERRAGTVHAPHADLAALLCTSGSTGSAKLVRLSHTNLQANAEAIANYLGIRSSDRAITTLPPHYCYGLSVLNSHLACGAGVILTGRSVADPGFWELARARRATSFAAVPYTFDLLDRVGFDAMDLPDLRYVTQAGGRLAPERVRRYAAIGRARGWDLYVMYGQTEATARMAYLPPDLVAVHPASIGYPIPGGSFRLDPLPDWPDPDTGELVYRGPNVMLGYAGNPSDLGLGRTVDELRTGDVARRFPDGRYEIVGRRSRFVKIFGLRVDLQQVEDRLAAHGVTGYCLGRDGELAVAAAGPAEAVRLRNLAAAASGLPARAVRAHVLAELPRLPNGKPDYPATEALTRSAPPPASHDTDLRALYADILGADDVTGDSTFVGLGGDSLSYVEMSVRLERALGHLPADWPTTPIRDLRRAARARGSSLDTSAALRAIAIVLIVGTHVELFGISGGAHVLLGVAGYNVARFHLTGAAHRSGCAGWAEAWAASWRSA